MPTDDPRLAYCSVCRGVLPFQVERRRTPLGPRARFTCERCGTAHLAHDPGAPIRLSAMRFLVYSAMAGLAASAGALGASMLEPERRPATWALAGLVLVAFACAGRAGWLALRSGDYERLTPWERQDLDRRLCVGMIRSDVVDDLAGRGWRIGKIRTALESLRPG